MTRGRSSSIRREEAARAARLFEAARGYLPRPDVTFAEVEAAVEEAGGRRLLLPSFLPSCLFALAVGLPIVLVLATGSIAMSRGWLWRRVPPPSPTTVSVPSGTTTSVERRGRFRLAIRGPATVELGAADDQPVRVDGGELVVSAEQRAVTVDVRGRHLVVPPSTIVSVAAEGAPGVPAEARLASLSNHQAPAPAMMPAPADPVPPALRAIGHAAAGDATPSLAPPPPAPSPVARRAAPVPRSDKRRAVHAAVPHASALASGVGPAEAPPDETSYIRDALARLRGGADPAAALWLLDERDRIFAEGTFAEEARSIRIEALLALGRSAEALERLEALPEASLARSRRLRVARGELRAARGRCVDALGDFAAVLDAAAANDEIASRARRGQAACAAAASGAQGAGAGSEVGR